MPKTLLYSCWWLLSWSSLYAQYAPAAGLPGSTALHRDSATWVGWATQCDVRRGPMDRSQPGLGTATAGQSHQALGAAGDGGTVSLGDGGSATLQFAHPIQDGPGPDFAVFENAFNNTFLELAFVEVSSDGQRFVRFPAVSNTDTTTQVGSFGAVDPTQLYNLAGKYRANYGTPFDLDELRDSAGLDRNAVTHVRLVDAVGSIDPRYGSRDHRGHWVNDPWNTPFASSGFDLDAVGVLHQGLDNRVVQLPTRAATFYPNPVTAGGLLFYKNETATAVEHLALYNCQGQCLWRQAQPTFPLPLPALPTGVYLLRAQTANGPLLQRLTLTP